MKSFLRNIIIIQVLFIHLIYGQDGHQCTSPILPFSGLRSSVVPTVIKLRDKVIIVEYPSVFDVHNKPDTVKFPNIRIQPVFFDVAGVLNDIKPFVKSDQIDFVLFFFLQEVPGWINSGGRWKLPAQNLGLGNTFNTLPPPTGWSRLKANPHMNDVDFLKRTAPGIKNFGSTMTVFHEIGHYTSVYFCQNSPGPREWKSTMPIAHLAAASSHWSYNYIVENKIQWPGIMYSGPTSDIFNAFDLYAMGLMTYEDASKHNYTVYEDMAITKTHKISLDDLIFSLKQAGGSVYSEPGKRVPAVDPSFANLNVLTVVVKGKDEIMSSLDSSLIIKLVDDMPRDWNNATWGKSKMATNLDLNNTFQISTGIKQDVLDPSILFNWISNNRRLSVLIPENYNKNELDLVIHTLDGRQLFLKKLIIGVNEIEIPSDPASVLLISVYNKNKLVGVKKIFAN